MLFLVVVGFSAALGRSFLAWIRQRPFKSNLFEECDAIVRDVMGISCPAELVLTSLAFDPRRKSLLGITLVVRWDIGVTVSLLVVFEFLVSLCPNGHMSIPTKANSVQSLNALRRQGGLLLTRDCRPWLFVELVLVSLAL